MSQLFVTLSLSLLATATLTSLLSNPGEWITAVRFVIFAVPSGLFAIAAAITLRNKE